MNFAERYRAMSETELMDLARGYEELIEDAQAALRAEFAKRGLEPPLIEEEEEPVMDDAGAELVEIGQYRGLPEALVVRAVLEEAGIRCFLRDEEHRVNPDGGWSNLHSAECATAGCREGRSGGTRSALPAGAATVRDRFRRGVCATGVSEVGLYGRDGKRP